MFNTGPQFLVYFLFYEWTWFTPSRQPFFHCVLFQLMNWEVGRLMKKIKQKCLTAYFHESLKDVCVFKNKEEKRHALPIANCIIYTYTVYILIAHITAMCNCYLHTRNISSLIGFFTILLMNSLFFVDEVFSSSLFLPLSFSIAKIQSRFLLDWSDTRQSRWRWCEKEEGKKREAIVQNHWLSCSVFTMMKRWTECFVRLPGINSDADDEKACPSFHEMDYSKRLLR